MNLLTRSIISRPWNENGIRGLDDVQVFIGEKRERKERRETEK